MLEKLEIEEQILNVFTDDKPLFYVESGSRLWGMASPNSDYDIRGFHLESKEKYLDYKSHRDIKEIMDGDFDFVSYTLDKMFSLIQNSNPTVLEWIRSNIIYYNVLSDFENFKSQILSNINYLSLFGHYTSLAKNNFKLMEQDNKFTYKKSLYCIRGILSARVALEETIPELLIDKLFLQCEEDYLLEVARICLEKKKQSQEKSQVSENIQNSIKSSISQALKNLENIDFKANNKKETLSKILTDYSVFIKNKYYCN
jgi:predicted nucleotidyltransferase